MPIHLFTGVGGSSKTLNAVRMIKEDEVYQNRPVYYFNIKEVVFEDWIELSEDEALRWYELPAGSVIFFDECQKIFRLTDHKKETPKHITELETHRHNGYDLVCTTQHPMLTATGFRRQVGRHWHFERQFGFERARCLKWEKAVKDPVDDYFARQDAETENIKFPKKYYGTYKSTEINTFKKRIPKKLIYVIIMFLLVAAGIVHFLMRMTDKYATDTPVSSGSTSSEHGAPAKSESSFKAVYPLDPQEYLNVFKPRIEGLAHTAPIYDELTKPQRAPKTICIRIHRSSNRECNCFTEQGTRLSVPLNRCESIVDNGLYDPTIPLESSRAANNSRNQSSPLPVAAPVVHSASINNHTQPLVLPRTSNLPSDLETPSLPIVVHGDYRVSNSVPARTLHERIYPTDLPPVKAVW